MIFVQKETCPYRNPMNLMSTNVLYKVLVVEDDPTFSQQLTGFLVQTNLFEPPVVCTSALEALKMLATVSIDILFLDISLPDMSGLDLLRVLSKSPSVIISTAHSDSAVDFYDLDVADFLLKPYEYSRFLRALSRAMRRTTPLPEPVPVKSSEVIPAGQDAVYLKSGRRLERFPFQDILYVEAYGIYSKIHTPDGVFAVSRRISSLLTESQLPAQQFIRVHKSFIVNVIHIRRVDIKQVWIKGAKVPIGITYRPIVNNQFKSLGLR